MKRTTVKLPDELDAQLRAEARTRGTTVSELTRMAIDQLLNGGPSDGGLDLGVFEPRNPADTRDTETYLREELLPRLADRNGMAMREGDKPWWVNGKPWWTQE